jgi:hypothetical protein
MFTKLVSCLQAHWPVIRKETANWVRYLYFLRFAILLWFFPVILRVANSRNAAESMVAGIMTPVTPLQYLRVAFFLISARFVALIMARVVVINGRARFGEDPPALLAWLLANPKQEWEWIGQGPNVVFTEGDGTQPERSVLRTVVLSLTVRPRQAG